MADFATEGVGGGVAGGENPDNADQQLGGIFSLPVYTVDADLWHAGVSGTISLPLLRASGAIWQSGIGGTLHLPSLASTGIIINTATLAGTIRLPALSASGTPVQGCLLDGTITIPIFRLNGKNIVGRSLTANISLPAVLVAGEVVQGYLLALDATLPGFTVEGNISLNGGYTVLVINIENYARSEYREFFFNSMISVGGKAYGASDDGIYLLEGPDDDGAYINAFITTGLNDLGTSVKKNVPDVYLGYDTDGQIGIQSITDDMTEGSEQVKEKAVNEIGKARVKMPMGRMSRYWGYRIRNIAGASLELDSIEPRQSVGVRRV
jgi:hypothetical protein